MDQSPKPPLAEAPLLTAMNPNQDLEQQDDYLKFKKLEKNLEHLDVMEEYVKLETRNLAKELIHAQEEVRIVYGVFLWHLVNFLCSSQ